MVEQEANESINTDQAGTNETDNAVPKIKKTKKVKTGKKKRQTAKAETPGQGPGPSSPQWTHRFNPPGAEPPHYALFDHVWVSEALSDKITSAHIDRRTKHGGDGSDHDPAWVVLDI